MKFSGFANSARAYTHIRISKALINCVSGEKHVHVCARSSNKNATRYESAGTEVYIHIHAAGGELTVARVTFAHHGLSCPEGLD